MPSTVYVSRAGNDVNASVFRLLDQVDLPDLQGKTVLVKPNMGRLAPNDSGIVASRTVIMAVVDYFRTRSARVWLGDSPITGVASLDAFERAGITADGMPEGTELIDLDAEPPVKVRVPDGKLIKSMRVCAAVKAADFLVSVPVMKTHMHTVVSLGLKNLKGCLYKKEKVKFHKLEGGDAKTTALDIAIADLATALLPDLTVIDGTVGMEGFGPSSGETVHPGLLLAGIDCLAVDAAASRLMGFDPQDIPILRLSAERRRGVIDADAIEVVPPEYLEWKHPFKPAPLAIDIHYDGVFVYDAGACSACMSTLLLFLERYADEVRELFNNEPVHIYIGEQNDVKKDKNAILVGRCTGRDKGKGLFVQGCPPVASDIMEKIREGKAGQAGS